MAQDFGKQLNFQEACTNAFKLFQDRELPYNLQDIFENPKINDSTEDFWQLCSGLKKFYEQQGTLPVAGNIPDMTSYTDFYMKLQQIYIKKASDDLALFKQCLSKEMSDEDVSLFCKNAKQI